ncbi:MAG: 1,4-dihydroxy-2-naphthoate polyprenyltransferase [Anaerolineae bacterium]
MFRHWLAAVRPRTLPVAIAPVLVGTALAWREQGNASLAVLVAAGVAALLIQAGTNLHNDVADFERGADDPGKRLGPARATAEGWLAPAAVRQAAIAVFAAAAAVGLWLVWLGGWPILVVGIASLACAWAYSGGPRPIAYSPWGEVFVWVFFGLAAVCGTYYLHAGELTGTALAAGAVFGLPAAAVLVVNNYRDLEHDAEAGRRTFAVVFGRPPSRVLYAVLMLAPVVAAVAFISAGDPAWLPVLVLLPWAGILVRRFAVESPGPEFNVLLGDTARYELAFAGLYGAGLVAAALSG